ncbi:MAG: ssl1498 family light-harvesting-like protein [Cyanobacteriota bacterium]|nr:ssl1498 family light-harvesting-like protein [Cyanobacteriota bacterium]
MPYTTEEGGRLNNFANEPKMYQADPPNKNEQRNYIILGVLALGLVGGLFFVAFTVSGAI